MKLIVISGRSGSGKTTALQALEDQGYYCVDNLPIGLLPTLALQLEHEDHHIKRVAVGIDARNLPSQLKHFPDVLEEVRERDITCEVIFLDAGEQTLLKRFSATRRKHPLSNDNRSLAEAIVQEGELLAAIAGAADLTIDTSTMSVHDLRNLIRERVAQRTAALSLLFQSFAYKQGVPHDADVVFDVRVLPNPHWVAELRPFTGRDDPVVRFLEQQPDTGKMLDDISGFLHHWLPRFQANDRTYMTVAIGCTGGRHRSVYITEQLAARFADSEVDVQIRHRELD